MTGPIPRRSTRGSPGAHAHTHRGPRVDGHVGHCAPGVQKLTCEGAGHMLYGFFLERSRRLYRKPRAAEPLQTSEDVPARAGSLALLTAHRVRHTSPESSGPGLAGGIVFIDRRGSL